MATSTPITLAFGGEDIRRILADVPLARRRIGVSHTVALFDDASRDLNAFLATEENVAEAKRRGGSTHGLNDESGALFEATLQALDRVAHATQRLEGDDRAIMAAKLIRMQLGLQDKEDRAFVMQTLLSLLPDLLLKKSGPMAENVNRTISLAFGRLARLEALQFGLSDDAGFDFQTDVGGDPDDDGDCGPYPAFA